MLTTIERLLQFNIVKYRLSAFGTSRSWPRVASPTGDSSLITSAPIHASSCEAVGPACTCVMSRMRIPFNASIYLFSPTRKLVGCRPVRSPELHLLPFRVYIIRADHRIFSGAPSANYSKNSATETENPGSSSGASTVSPTRSRRSAPPASSTWISLRSG